MAKSANDVQICPSVLSLFFTKHYARPEISAEVQAAQSKLIATVLWIVAPEADRRKLRHCLVCCPDASGPQPDRLVFESVTLVKSKTSQPRGWSVS